MLARTRAVILAFFLFPSRVRKVEFINFVRSEDLILTIKRASVERAKIRKPLYLLADNMALVNFVVKQIWRFILAACGYGKKISYANEFLARELSRNRNGITRMSSILARDTCSLYARSSDRFRVRRFCTKGNLCGSIVDDVT